MNPSSAVILQTHLTTSSSTPTEDDLKMFFLLEMLPVFGCLNMTRAGESGRKKQTNVNLEGGKMTDTNLVE